MNCPDCAHANPPDNRFCGHCGAKLGQPVPENGGERRPLTVLFCDIVGSTVLSARLDAEDYHALVQSYQRAARESITAQRGHIAHNLGDGVLTYFGYPAAAEDDAVRAVQAGVDIVAAMRQLNLELEASYGLRIAVRVGIHSGSAVVGSVGAGAEAIHLAFGDVVNLASRFEAIAPDNCVVVSEYTRRLTGRQFVMEDLGRQQLKGAATAMVAFRVTPEAPGVAAGRRAESHQLIGRGRELQTLTTWWKRVCSGAGSGGLIIGEAGIGKSQLVEALVAGLSPDLEILRLDCLADRRRHGLHPLLDGLLVRLQSTDADPQTQVRALESDLVALGLPASELLPLLAPLFRLAVPEHLAIPELHPEALHERGQLALVDWVRAIGRDTPALLIVEDLHWADATMHGWLELLLTELDDARLLVLLTTRENTTFRAGVPHPEIVRLTPLSPPHTAELISWAAPRTELAPEYLRKLVERADGVPMFAREIARSLEVDGAGEDLGQIPLTLQAALVARLDRLGPARALAQIAAVIGREFSYDHLRQVAGSDIENLDQALGKLVASEVVTAKDRDDSRYAFGHALMREAAYDAMLRRRRQELHGRAAQVLRGDRSVSAVVLANHCEAGGKTEWAISAWQRAVAEAERIGDLWQARRHIERLEVLAEKTPDPDERVNVKLNVALQLINAKRGTTGFDESLKRELDDALVLAQQVEDFRRGFVLLGFVTHHTHQGEHVKSIEHARLALQVARQSGISAIEVLCEIALAQSCISLGQYRRAVAHCERAVELYRAENFQELGAGIPRADVLANGYMALASWHLGQTARSLELIRRAVSLAEDGPPHPPTLGTIHYIEAWVYLHRRDPQQARASVERGLDATNRYGDRHTGTMLRYVGACIDVIFTPTPEAVDRLAGMHQEYFRSGGAGRALLHACCLATGNFSVGRFDLARDILERALGLLSSSDERYALPELHRARAMLLRHDDRDFAAAEDALRLAISVAREQESLSFEVRALTDLVLLKEKSDIAANSALLEKLSQMDEESHDVADARAALELAD